MVDEIYDRGYQAGRSDLHNGIDRLLHRIATTFEAISRVQFKALWNSGPRAKA